MGVASSRCGKTATVAMRNEVMEAIRAERRALREEAKQSIEEARRARHLLQATIQAVREARKSRPAGKKGRPSSPSP